MKKRIAGLAILFCCCTTAFSQEKQNEANKAPTISQVLDRQLSTLERDFVPLAEAVPEDKFEFAPSNGEFKGVRTFAQQVKHVAAINFLVAAGVLQEKPKVDPKQENGLDDTKSKADIIKFLKDSFGEAHRAIATITDKNAVEPIPSAFDAKSKTTRLSLGTTMTWHSFDHYGQMVVYARMNGIIPPASRQ